MRRGTLDTQAPKETLDWMACMARKVRKVNLAFKVSQVLWVIRAIKERGGNKDFLDQS